MIRSRDHLFGDELVVALLSQIQPGTKFYISDDSDFAVALAPASQNPRFKEFFVNYPFDTDGVSPYCRPIADGFASLQQARILGRQNPDLVEYTVDEEIHMRFEMFIKSKVGDKAPLLAELATEMRKHIDFEQ